MGTKYTTLNIRADSPWLTGLDDLAVLLRLGNRSRVIDLAVELLAAMAEKQIPPEWLIPSSLLLRGSHWLTRHGCLRMPET